MYHMNLYVHECMHVAMWGFFYHMPRFVDQPLQSRCATARLPLNHSPLSSYTHHFSFLSNAGQLTILHHYDFISRMVCEWHHTVLSLRIIFFVTKHCLEIYKSCTLTLMASQKYVHYQLPFDPVSWGLSPHLMQPYAKDIWCRCQSPNFFKE